MPYLVQRSKPCVRCGILTYLACRKRLHEAARAA